MSKNVQTDEQALQNFLLDIQCLDELLPWTGKFNLFDVLKISRTEIRHSNVLGWLLDPNENHGFGDAFLKGMFQRIVENDTEGKYDIFGVLLSDMYSFIVRREWNNIDILLTSSDEKIVLAIENKVGSQEHSNQLSRYSKIIEKKYPDFNRIYIYLTPEGEEPKDVENWDILSYKDIVEVLEDIMNRIKLQPDVSVMVNNYIKVIRRNILEDQQLIEICNKIYNKHKRALDLIFEHRDDEKSQMKRVITDTLNELGEEGKIIYGEKEMVFRTEKMDELLPPLDKPESSWDSNYIYTYWLLFIDGRLCGVFELGGSNVPKESFETMQKIIDELKPNDTRRNFFKYKRVFRTKWYDLRYVDDLEEEVKKAVRSAVEELFEVEKRVIASINGLS